MRAAAGSPEGARRGRRPDAGLTLIELVVAMAVFALVAVMGLGALSGSLRMRDRLVRADDAAAELGLTLDLMRSDLAALVPLLFYRPGGPIGSALAFGPGGRLLELSLGGQPALPSAAGTPAPGFNRVEWRLSPDGRLTRSAWPTLWPTLGSGPGSGLGSGASGQRAPEVTVMTGVTAMRLRSHWPGAGWIEGAGTAALRQGAVFGSAEGSDADGARGPVAESYSDSLPEAVELTLETRDFGTLTLVESLK